MKFVRLCSFFIFTFAFFASTQSAQISAPLSSRDGLGFGAKCSTSTQCASGYCGRAHCAEKKKDGHACYKDAGCLSGSCYNKHTCVTPGNSVLGNGSKCSTSTSCASNNCDHAQCHDKKPDGAYCYKAANCISNNCSSAACAPQSGSGTTTSTLTSTTSSARPITSSSSKSLTTKSSSTTHLTITTTSTTSSKTTTTTSKTITTSSHTTSTTSTKAPQATIQCTIADSTDPPPRIGNIPSQVFEGAPAEAYPNPYETFQVGSTILRATKRSATPLNVEVYYCTSKYMGYKAEDNFNGHDPYDFGQIRIPSLNNECITATSPGADSTTLTHKPCSLVDDASQIAQFFRFYYRGDGPQADYLGATYTSSKSNAGRDYCYDADVKAGDALITKVGKSCDGVGTLYFL